VSAAPRSLDEARALIEALTVTASARGGVLPAPPAAPDPRSCCQRGCERCVFVAYYEALGAWRQQALYAIFKLV